MTLLRVSVCSSKISAVWIQQFFASLPWVVLLALLRFHLGANTHVTLNWQFGVFILQIPEILFGNNALELYHEPSGLVLLFEARGALKDWVKLFAEGAFEVNL